MIRRRDRVSQARMRRRRTRSYAVSVALPRAQVAVRRERGPMSAVRVVGLSLLAVLALAIAVLLFSDTFYVYEVEATGMQALSPARLLAASGVEQYSIFYLRRQDIAARIKELPEVKDAMVQVRLPNRVVVQVQEREPVAVWRRGNVQMWVDTDGVLLPALADLPDSPVILDTSTGALEQGQTVDKEAVLAALEYRRLVPEAKRYQYTPGVGISMLSAPGWPVHLGTASDAEVKVFVTREISRWLEKRGVRPRYIDVRVPTAPTYKP